MRCEVSRLRLLMTTDAVGGVLSYALDLAEGLRPHGVETVLVVLGPPMSVAQRSRAAAIDSATIVETGLPLDWLAASEADICTAAIAIARLAALHKADVVQLNTPALAVADFSMPVVAVAHSCVASWWAAVRGTALPSDFAWRTEIMAAGLRAADAVICPSASFRTALNAIYGVSPIVVHNGRARPSVTAAVSTTSAIAFSAGRLWDEGKDVATLDRAAALTRTPVEAAGPLGGPDGSRKVVGHLASLGVLSEASMRARLASRPIFVSTAVYEPFGLTVLEAAQAGCPLVLADIPTFRELWDGVARFVAARDAVGFAAAIDALAADSAERRRLGNAARARAETYGLPRMTAAMAGLFKALVSDAAPKARRAAA